MDEGHPFLPGQGQGVLVGVVVGIAVEHGAGAQGAYRLHLDRRGGGGHHDQSRNPQPLAGQGHALGVVARRGGNHPARLLGLGEIVDLVVGAAQLEGKDALQILAFEPHFGVQALREAGGGIEGGFAGHVINAGAEDAFQVVVSHGSQATRSSACLPKAANARSMVATRVA